MKHLSFFYPCYFLLLAGILTCSSCRKKSDGGNPEPANYISLINTLSLDGVPLDSFEYNNRGKLAKSWHYNAKEKSYNKYIEYIYGSNGTATGYNLFLNETGDFKLRVQGTTITTGSKTTIYTESFVPDGTSMGKGADQILANEAGQVIMHGTTDTVVLRDHVKGSAKRVYYQNLTYNNEGLKFAGSHYYITDTWWGASTQEDTEITFGYTDNPNHMYRLVAGDPVMRMYLSTYQYLIAGPLCLSATSTVINNAPPIRVTYTYTYDRSNQWKEMIINYPADGSTPAHTARYTATYKRIDIK
ncbi:hypothetical protein ECE50_027205 [Chitinophaga sp. Mgbs1]|uniref:Uncharacterized protein n=1 Tax=Chitinophaga solisilvae TaxID=1233460 RepID=A0A3S1CRZ5_9BACT|nr:hypothetical protein [Chitinophaga solisilvae]